MSRDNPRWLHEIPKAVAVKETKSHKETEKQKEFHKKWLKAVNNNTTQDLLKDE